MTSEAEKGRELRILETLSASSACHPGSAYVNKLLDHFTLTGPNGSHDCLVLELVGPNIADFVDQHCRDDRLPSTLAKMFAKHVLEGLDFLAVNDVCHGGKSDTIG